MVCLASEMNRRIPELLSDTPETKYIIESMKPGLYEHVSGLTVELFTSMMSIFFRQSS